MLTSLQTEAVNFALEEQTASIQKRLNSANERSAQIEGDWNSKIQQFKSEANATIVKIEERHSIEQRELQAEWDRPEALLPFSKPSPTLLQLRKQKKALAIVRSYEEAKRLKEECERLMEEEAVVAGQRAAEAMRAEFVQLRERQKREVDCFVEHAKAHIARLETQREAELRANENLKKQLQARLAANRRPSIVAPRARVARSSPSPLSPGTMMRLNSFRKEADGAKLSVKLDGLEEIARAAVGNRQIARF
jgi:hypothetical protein